MTMTARSIFPAFLPTLAIAGVTSPRISRGIMNFRIWANSTLKVFRTRTRASGAMRPRRAPKTMATMTLANSPNLIIFIVGDRF